MDYRTEKIVEKEEYPDGYRQLLQQKGTCPYAPVTLLGNKFEALLYSGSALSLISRSAADLLMKSTKWQELKKIGKVDHKIDLHVSALNCDGKPINISGRIILPTMSIGDIDLKKECSFWIMEGGVDSILISNSWMKPLQGALVFKKNKQYPHFQLPKGELRAGGEANAEGEEVEEEEEDEQNRRR